MCVGDEATPLEEDPRPVLTLKLLLWIECKGEPGKNSADGSAGGGQ